MGAAGGSGGKGAAGPDGCTAETAFPGLARPGFELQRNQNPYPLYVRAYVNNLSISLPCDVNTVGSLIDSI